MRTDDCDALASRAHAGDAVARSELILLLQQELRSFIATYATNQVMTESVFTTCWHVVRQWLAQVCTPHPQSGARDGLWMGHVELEKSGSLMLRLREQALSVLRQQLIASLQQTREPPDPLLQAIAQTALDALPASSTDAPDVLRLIRDKIRLIPPAANGLLAKRYAENRSVAEIGRIQGRSTTEVASALAMARTAVDWQADGMMLMDPCDLALPTYIEGYLADGTDAAVRHALVQHLQASSGRSATFVRQLRLDLVLDACTRVRTVETDPPAPAPSEPPRPTRTSNRLPVASHTPSHTPREVRHTSTSAGRVPKAGHHPKRGASAHLWLAGGGIVVLLSIVIVILMRAPPTLASPRLATPTIQVTEAVPPTPHGTPTAHDVTLVTGTGTGPGAMAPTSQRVPAPPKTISTIAGKPTFVRGIAFGDSAVTIGGNGFLAMSDALRAGLALANGTTAAPVGVISTPGLDFDLKAMLGVGLASSEATVGLSQVLPNCAYEVQLWIANAKGLGDELPQVSLQGAVVTSATRTVHASTWCTLGPYPASVTNRMLDIQIAKLGGARVCGISFTAIGRPSGGVPPLVLVVAPSAGTEVFGELSVTTRVVGASDVASVAILNGDHTLFQTTKEPYHWTWTDAPLGSVTLRAQVTDSVGTVTSSPPVSFTVVADTDPFLTVAEAKGYSLVYALDLARLAHSIRYDVDKHDAVPNGFDRIGYFLEVSSDGGPRTWVWTSMDAFTTDISKIGIPTLGSGAFFQQDVAHLVVATNMPTVMSGSFATGGNIEFWPNDYDKNNTAHVPNATDQFFDFGDQPTDPKDGYGCMQVHNHDAQQTVFAINHWVAGRTADIGLGNSANGESRDWTFSGNAHTWAVKKLRIFVRPQP